MAKIISLVRTSKDINPNADIVADYNMDDKYFSIWSYKKGDISRSGTCSQNMQFDKDIARQLRDALNQFLLEK